MELTSLFGLPAHPLIVHAAVVLVPLAAIGTIAIAVSRSARRRLGWIVLALAVAGWLAALGAQMSGGPLEELVDESPEAEEHGEMGNDMPVYAFLIPLAAAGVMALDVIERRRGEDTPAPNWQKPATIAVTVLAVGASVLGTYEIARVGHSGAKATWDDATESPGGAEG